MKKNNLAIIGRILRSALSNKTFITLSRKALRPFPAIESRARVLNYKLKKIGRKSNPNISSQITMQKKHDREKNHIFFDVSELSSRDVHTGIQRVVWSIFSEFTSLQLAPIVVRANAQDTIVYAEKLIEKYPAHYSQSCYKSGIIKISPGDLFFSADLRLTFPFSSLQEFHSNGLRVIFTIDFNKQRLIALV